MRPGEEREGGIFAEGFGGELQAAADGGGEARAVGDDGGDGWASQRLADGPESLGMRLRI